MSAAQAVAEADARVDLALYGLGLVGDALLRRLARLQARGALAHLRLTHLANARGARLLRAREDIAFAAHTLRAHARSSSEVIAPPPAGALIIDATASDAVAAAHPRWLGAGHAVVTANKLGLGGPTERARAIAAFGASRYGDSATVGAGLPILESVRRLRHGGERIIEIAGVLSGSLAWLLDHDVGVPFALRVLRARELGYTEPDPRIDLSGADVRRKLAILARAAGFDAAAERIVVAPLVALPSHRAFDPDALGAATEALSSCERAARARGQVLRYVARVDATSACIGIEALDCDDPLASGRGCENVAIVRSERYDDAPLIVRGPGAGAERTAAALLDDALRLAPPGPRRMTSDLNAVRETLR